MKFAMLKSTLLISGLVVSVVACTNSKTAKNVSSKTSQQQTTSETTTVNGQTVSEKYSYRLEDNGCDTELRKFDSKEAMCAGLQDEKLNNFCAPEAREEKFKASCKGTYKPFVSDSLGNVDVEKGAPDLRADAPEASDKMAVKEISEKGGLEYFKMTADQDHPKAISAVTIVSCDSNPASSITSRRNGILLLPSSKAVLTRDLNNVLPDGSTTAGLHPFVTLKCAGNEAAKTVDLTTLDPSKFELKEIKVSNIVEDFIVTSPEVETSERQSGIVSISCSDDTASAMKSALNGIQLMKGSSVVLVRDLQQKPDQAPYLVVTCR